MTDKTIFLVKSNFELGSVVATPAVINALKISGENVSTFINRHSNNDWGKVSDENKKENNLALKNNERLYSTYLLKTGVKIWIITEWDRSVTTVLLPSDY